LAAQFRSVGSVEYPLNSLRSAAVTVPLPLVRSIGDELTPHNQMM
jgi:hypothetical protein